MQVMVFLPYDVENEENWVTKHIRIDLCSN